MTEEKEMNYHCMGCDRIYLTDEAKWIEKVDYTSEVHPNSGMYSKYCIERFVRPLVKEGIFTESQGQVQVINCMEDLNKKIIKGIVSGPCQPLLPLDELLDQRDGYEFI